MCQRPKRAFIISTTIPDRMVKNQPIVCQRPKRAFIISTRRSLKNLLFSILRCQRPKRAFIISTDGKYGCRGTPRVCQRPKRAFIISTVPAENPHKHWLCGLIFAGICLNILISKLFQPFFGMFTICSYSLSSFKLFGV